MPGWNRLHTLISVVLAPVVCTAVVAKADTVVLKNGRQITAESATRENGKIICETPSGRLVLPESIVARIETNDLGIRSARAPNPSAASLQLGPPAMDISGAVDLIARAVIHGGAIDRDALERLNAAASGGAADARERAAAAEMAASGFAYGRGEFAAALSHAQRALGFAPDQVTLLLNVAFLHLKRGEYAASLDFLERARRGAPKSPDVARLTGWAYYALNRLPQSVAEWKRAQQLAPDAEVAKALAKAELDLEIESSFRENQSAHFVLRYNGSAAPDLARTVLSVLEEDFSEISSVLHHTPAEPIAVLLYTNQTFADITRAPNWVGALNDGKIRIPVQGLATVTPELARVLKHELTHSFIAEKTRERCPVWLQEGLAQWMEGKRAGNAAAVLVDLYDRYRDPSLSALESSWLNLPADVAGTAYAWSLAVVEMLEAGGPDDVNRFLENIASESSAEAVLIKILHRDYADLSGATAAYLRRTYLRRP